MRALITTLSLSTHHHSVAKSKVPPFFDFVVVVHVSMLAIIKRSKSNMSSRTMIPRKRGIFCPSLSNERRDHEAGEAEGVLFCSLLLSMRNGRDKKTMDFDDDGLQKRR